MEAKMETGNQVDKENLSLKKLQQFILSKGFRISDSAGFTAGAIKEDDAFGILLNDPDKKKKSFCRRLKFSLIFSFCLTLLCLIVTGFYFYDHLEGLRFGLFFGLFLSVVATLAFISPFGYITDPPCDFFIARLSIEGPEFKKGDWTSCQLRALGNEHLSVTQKLAEDLRNQFGMEISLEVESTETRYECIDYGDPLR